MTLARKKMVILYQIIKELKINVMINIMRILKLCKQEKQVMIQFQKKILKIIQ
jgi:hypothetical protein